MRKVQCSICGKSPALHGVYLERTSAKGEVFEGICKPSCNADLPQETKILMAISGSESLLAELDKEVTK